MLPQQLTVKPRGSPSVINVIASFMLRSQLPRIVEHLFRALFAIVQLNFEAVLTTVVRLTRNDHCPLHLSMHPPPSSLLNPTLPMTKLLSRAPPHGLRPPPLPTIPSPNTNLLLSLRERITLQSADPQSHFSSESTGPLHKDPSIQPLPLAQLPVI